MNERTTPAEITAAEATAETQLSQLNPGNARTRMANSLRDAMLPRIEGILGNGDAADDWRAEHLDPAYEAVRVGQMSRRRAVRHLEELLACHPRAA